MVALASAGIGVIGPDLFREYSIRGLADRELTDDVVIRVGQAIGVYFARCGATTFVVGRDARVSSPRISRTLIEGLLASGAMVTDVGMVPTPVHNFATDLYRADAGVMVTASHNPPGYNGLKVRGRNTLGRQELEEIYRIANAPATQPAANSRSNLSQANPVTSYVERVSAYADLCRPPFVVVDGGNGTSGSVAAGLLRDLGCRVVELFCEPDGRFPNRDPDPTAPGATHSLAEAVRRERAEVGLAFDGDGDRLVVVDEGGNRVLGDQVLMILARDVLSQGPARIAFESLCTRALADDVITHGGEPIVTPTGYAFVHAAMQSTGAAVGGELSGHLFFNLPDFRFDDALLGALRLLNVLSRIPYHLSELVATLPAYHSSSPIRLSCADPMKVAVVARIRDHFSRNQKVDAMDGARIDFADGWAQVRASNTQPALSLRFEARSEKRLVEITGLVMAQVDLAMKELSAV